MFTAFGSAKNYKPLLLYIMPFIKRLGFYLFGVSIGIIFLAFFFKKKTEDTGAYFCYFPNCRTLKDIRNKPMSYDDLVLAKLYTKEIDTADIKSLLTHGDIDFGESTIRDTPCKIYKIEGEIRSKPVMATVVNCPKKAEIQSITYLTD